MPGSNHRRLLSRAPDGQRPSPTLHGQVWAAVTGLVLICTPAMAAPDKAQPQAPDPVLQLLQERGLVPTQVGAEPRPWVREVRDRASELVVSAMAFLGVTYRRGGNSFDEGFDCSGFTRHVFEHSLGIKLPRQADEQAEAPGLQPVTRDELRPGDLVFFNTLRRTFSHVGIYVGNGRFIHAPKPGAAIRMEDMGSSYWLPRFTGARRANTPGPAATAQSAHGR